jgi:thiol-disulfide isomerase/thioredoxin
VQAQHALRAGVLRRDGRARVEQGAAVEAPAVAGLFCDDYRALQRLQARTERLQLRMAQAGVIFAEGHDHAEGRHAATLVCATFKTMPVHELTIQQVADAVKTNAVLLMYAPWCGHCQQFKQPFEEWAARNPHVHFGQFNADSGGKELVEKAPLYLSGELRGFPTVFLSTADRGTFVFEGPRTPAALQGVADALYKQ